MSALAVGLMSGTSLDGVDAALVRIHGADAVELVAFHTQPFAPADRTAILAALSRGSPRELALLNVELGNRFAEAVTAVLAIAGVPARELSFIASHGQTVWHEPGVATLQLGDPAAIAERFGVSVVSDFRSRDIAAGGQGAPLVVIADAVLFGHPAHGRALLNVGGMANVTWVPRRGTLDGVVAFDTGPGVAVLDAVTRQLDRGAVYDVEGRRAARGKPVDEVVAALLEHPFFAAPPPKSTGRELFGEAYATELIGRTRVLRPDATAEDCIATALELTVRSIAEAVSRWLPDVGERDLLVSGGGARNPVLVRRLAEALPGWTVRRFEEEFFDGDGKEAAAFAYLGWLTLQGRPGNVPGATGARGPRVLGRVTPP